MFAALGNVFGRFLSKQTPSIVETRNWLQQFTGGDIILTKDDNTGIATLCLQHPDKKNSITGYMMVALEKAVEVLETWETGKGVVVYGEDHTFCSGGNLSFARQIGNPTLGSNMSTFMQHTLNRLRNLPLISVALIEGAGAIGGGAEIALACDWRLLSPGCAGIGFVHQRMGIAPAWGGATWLTKAVGYRVALDLMTTGRIVSGQEAIDLGIADVLLVNEDSMSEAINWLLKRTQGPAQVVQRLKLMALNSSGQDLEKILVQENKLFSPLWGGAANVKALQAKIKHKN